MKGENKFSKKLRPSSVSLFYRNRAIGNGSSDVTSISGSSSNNNNNNNCGSIDCGGTGRISNDNDGRSNTNSNNSTSIGDDNSGSNSSSGNISNGGGSGSSSSSTRGAPVVAVPVVTSLSVQEQRRPSHSNSVAAIPVVAAPIEAARIAAVAPLFPGQQQQQQQKQKQTPNLSIGRRSLRSASAAATPVVNAPIMATPIEAAATVVADDDTNDMGGDDTSSNSSNSNNSYTINSSSRSSINSDDSRIDGQQEEQPTVPVQPVIQVTGRRILRSESAARQASTRPVVLPVANLVTPVERDEPPQNKPPQNDPLDEPTPSSSRLALPVVPAIGGAPLDESTLSSPRLPLVPAIGRDSLRPRVAAVAPSPTLDPSLLPQAPGPLAIAIDRDSLRPRVAAVAAAAPSPTLDPLLPQVQQEPPLPVPAIGRDSLRPRVAAITGQQSLMSPNLPHEPVPHRYQGQVALERQTLQCYKPDKNGVTVHRAKWDKTVLLRRGGDQKSHVYLCRYKVTGALGNERYTSSTKKRPAVDATDAAGGTKTLEQQRRTKNRRQRQVSSLEEHSVESPIDSMAGLKRQRPRRATTVVPANHVATNSGQRARYQTKPVCARPQHVIDFLNETIVIK